MTYFTKNVTNTLLSVRLTPVAHRNVCTNALLLASNKSNFVIWETFIQAKYTDF